MAAYETISRCRLGGGGHLISVLDLGRQYLTGVFPRSKSEPVTCGPLELAFSPDTGLVQLRHTYAASEMYGLNYGYRSGLNQSMVEHLRLKAAFLEKTAGLSAGDVVLDIGSNDATTLKAYSTPGLVRLGIDPTGAKFQNFYPPEIKLVPDFFSEDNYRAAVGRPARLATSIAMFYDLDDPIGFARQVRHILAADGFWHFEQSYLPTMLRMNSYDTICHEHLEYYSLAVVERILEAADFKLVDVSLNAVNGGSFAVTATPRANRAPQANRTVIDWLLAHEEALGLATPKPYRDFEERVFRHRRELKGLIAALAADGRRVLGYGASTKGNTLLQFCGFSPDEIKGIVDINPDKMGCYTPGTFIPIISEEEARLSNPDYYLVLPWHFRESILRREKEFLARGGKFIFPFPEIEIV